MIHRACRRPTLPLYLARPQFWCRLICFASSRKMRPCAWKRLATFSMDARGTVRQRRNEKCFLWRFNRHRWSFAWMALESLTVRWRFSWGFVEDFLFSFTLRDFNGDYYCVILMKIFFTASFQWRFCDNFTQSISIYISSAIARLFELLCHISWCCAASNQWNWMFSNCLFKSNFNASEFLLHFIQFVVYLFCWVFFLFNKTI